MVNIGFLVLATCHQLLPWLCGTRGEVQSSAARVSRSVANRSSAARSGHPPSSKLSRHIFMNPLDSFLIFVVFPLFHWIWGWFPWFSMGPALRLSWKVGRQNGEPKRRPVPPRDRPHGEGWELVSPLEDFAWRSGDWLRPVFFHPKGGFFTTESTDVQKSQRCGDLQVATVRQVFTEGMSGIWCSIMFLNMAETMFLS